MMSPYDRVMAVLQRQTPDCVPAFPILLLQGAAELGLSLEAYFSKGEHLAEGQLRLLDKYGHDCVFGFPHIVEDITAFGAGLIYFNNGPPSAAGMVIQSYDDIDRLTAPDPGSVPLLGETLKAIGLLAQEVKGHVPILGACIAPFSLPSMLMGTERWLDLMLFEEEEVRQPVMKRLLDITTDFCVAWANMQLAAGADAIVLADGMASASVINRQQFIDLALSVIKETIARINGPVVHEGVGSVHLMIDLLPQTGAIGVMLTCEDDLAEYKRMVGGSLALIGNLNNIEMRRWSPEDMTQKAQTALAAGAPGSGYILSAQGPEIPLGVDDAVIHAMVEAAHGWVY